MLAEPSIRYIVCSIRIELAEVEMDAVFKRYLWCRRPIAYWSREQGREREVGRQCWCALTTAVSNKTESIQRYSCMRTLILRYLYLSPKRFQDLSREWCGGNLMLVILKNSKASSPRRLKSVIILPAGLW